MSTNNIALVTDSTCDIPVDLIERYNIIVQAHTLIWNGQQYRDRVDIQPEEFYQRLTTEKNLPTTSQATIQEFTDTYQQVIDCGAQEIVAITVSGGLSGAYQSAFQGAKNVSVPVHIHDSRAATLGLGWQVIAAARVREDGGSAQDMIAAADRVRQRVRIVILLDTMEYLYRGGRIGNARRLLGSMLNIKPLIYVDHESGLVDACGMAMTHKKGIEQMYQQFFGQVDKARPLHLAVLHGHAADAAAQLLDRVRREFNPLELITNMTCPAIGIHTGPKALALCGYSD